MTGTLINVVTVVIGGLLGTLLGNRLSAKARETVMQGLGLVTLTIGLQIALSQVTVAENTLKRLSFVVVIASVLLGALIGEWLDVEGRLDSLGRSLEGAMARLSPGGTGQGGASTFTRGFVTASLVFCVGPMALIGFQDGLSGDYTLLAIKATLDGFSAIAFASSLGAGVIFSALTVLIYQGGLALSAEWASVFLTEAMIAEASATGGILMLGIGLMLLDIKRVRVANLLPAIFVAPLLSAVAVRFVSLVG